ncbi:acyltransferase family protein [Arthrobacter koreensis]|uniref:acyltransferase family protein n=2 Tax=Arthrobacter koreensis TaxID=199136 RepID=UPI000B8A211D
MVRKFRLRNRCGYATMTPIRGGRVSTGDNSGSAVKERLSWIDFSKGLCMVLVVLYHLSLWMETEVHSGPGLWWVISDALNPLRMPLFFFISGYLSVSALRRPLGSSRSRTLGLYYVYVLWTALFLLRRWLPFLSADAEPEVGQLLLSLVLPTSFWYLYALPVFFLATKFLLRMLGNRSAYALIPLAVMSALSPLVQPYTQGLLTEPFDAAKIPSVLANFLWFYLGVHGAALWASFSRRRSYGVLGLSAALYVAIYAVMTAFRLELLLETVLSGLALFVTAQLVSRINMDSRAGRGLRRIGSQTLPVYIFHIVLISALSAVVKLTGLMPLLQSSPGMAAAVVPPLLALPVILLCLSAGSLIKRSPFPWLLDAPSFLVGARKPKEDDSRAKAAGSPNAGLNR